MNNHFELVSNALEANKAHQSALAGRAQALTTKIQELDSLLVSTPIFFKTRYLTLLPPILADATNVLDEHEGKRLSTAIRVRGGVKPFTILQPSVLLKPESPFYHQASCRTRYKKLTVPCQMKGKELETLNEAVQLEKQRVQSLGQISSWEEDASDGLNWTSIADRVSAAHGNARTADECRVKWEEQLNNNTTRQRNPSRSIHVWSPESDLRLKEAVDRYGYENWLTVATMVSENATANQCEGRFLRVVDLSIKKGLWTQEEDVRLRKAVEAHGHSWIDVASTMAGRTNNQCRERWKHQQKMATSGTKKLNKDHDV